MRPLTVQEVTLFRSRVDSFYRENARLLPWRPPSLKLHRGIADPYRVLVSELMLQQTQVDRVIPAYSRFMKKFPTFQSVADASLARVLAAWQGLGYNRRARFLQQCARAVIHDFSGRLPRDPGVLMKLPGIGRATAGSIAAFAYNAPVVFIETNIRSVFIHHFFPQRKKVHDSEILPLVAQTLPKQRPREWYAALMDYGSVLKRRLANPSRRSAHHVRQGAFEGSDRQLRGRVLHAIIAAGRCSEKQLVQATGAGPEHLKRVLQGLAAHTLITWRKGSWCIAP